MGTIKFTTDSFEKLREILMEVREVIQKLLYGNYE